MRDPAIYLMGKTTTTNDDDNYDPTLNIQCPRLSLKNCFVNSSISSSATRLFSSGKSLLNQAFSQSCLYNKFFDNAYLTSSSSSSSSQRNSNNNNNIKTMDHNQHQSNVEAFGHDHVHHHGIDQLSQNLLNKIDSSSSSSTSSSSSSSSSSSFIITQETIESKFSYVYGGIIVLAIISLTALMLSIYLVTKRNHLTYHTTSSYAT